MFLKNIKTKQNKLFATLTTPGSPGLWNSLNFFHGWTLGRGNGRVLGSTVGDLTHQFCGKLDSVAYFRLKVQRESSGSARNKQETAESLRPSCLWGSIWNWLSNRPVSSEPRSSLWNIRTSLAVELVLGWGGKLKHALRGSFQSPLLPSLPLLQARDVSVSPICSSNIPSVN